jgi:hypothetical protein
MSHYPGFTFSVGAFLFCVIVGAILNFARRGKKHKERPLEPSPDRPSRLRIISSYYGVEGGRDEEVTETYLRPRIRGDALVAWVGADLFGAYQPVFGLKRLKVHYSFEGKDATIVREENQLLVLPEDPYLKNLRLAAEPNLVLDSDPKVYPEFTDARLTSGSDKKELQAYFTLVNRGGSEARNIILDPIEMHGNVIQFTRHRIAAPLLPKREAYFYPDVVTKENKSVTEREKDLFHLFCLDYIGLGDSTICEATTAVSATYQDSVKNLFEVSCELVFDPEAHNAARIGQRLPKPAIFTRNHKFRKIAQAVGL